MIDWLEEILSAAERQDEPGEENDLLSLRFLLAGAVPGAQRAAQGSVLPEIWLDQPATGIDIAKLAEGAASFGTYDPSEINERAPWSKSFLNMAGSGGNTRPESGAAVDSVFDVPGVEAILRGKKNRDGLLSQMDVLGRLALAEGTETHGRRRPDTGSALRMLYRRAGEAVRNTAVSAAQPGITVLQESPGTAAGLTAEELDRAVRRDSRRYDGGMSIY